MTAREPGEASDRPLSQDILYALRYHLGGRRGLIILATAVLVAGLAFNWSWLVAAGIAPLLVAILPCVAMCGLGLCMYRMAGRSCSTETTSPKESESAAGDPVASAPTSPALLAAPALRSAAAPEDDPEAATATEPQPERTEERTVTHA